MAQSFIMAQSLTIINLVLLICAAAMTLWLGARQSRIDRQVVTALPISHSASLPSIRRLKAGSRWLFLHRLANYRVGIAYAWHPRVCAICRCHRSSGNLLCE